MSLTCTLTLGFLFLDQILGPKTCMLHMFSSQPSNSHVLSVTSNVDPQPFYAVKSRGWSKINALIGCDLFVDYN